MAISTASIFPFVFDYASLVVIYILTIVLDYVMKPFLRPFRLDNIDISHPHLDNFVPSWAIVVFGIVAPIILVTIVLIMQFLFNRDSTKRNESEEELVLDAETSTEEVQIPSFSVQSLGLEYHRFVTGIAIAFIFTMLITDVVKNFAGRLRPDFLDRCKFVPNANATTTGWLFEGKDGVCTGDKMLVEDGRKSFPSGHSSESFSGITFFVLWILRTTGLVPLQKIVRGSKYRNKSILISGHRILLAGVLSIAAMLGATYIAISSSQRTQQYVHHPSDVATGMILGVVIAIVVFRAVFFKS
ncbi:hypothetical protein HK096_008040 [Nowakowskiella sp. JEL0078]|nr:hypothetical protein HK096_008040 [Nowakowskiella sp. JEL0078]